MLGRVSHILDCFFSLSLSVYVHMCVKCMQKALHTEAVIQFLWQVLEGYQALLEVPPAHLPHCGLRPWECTCGFCVSLAFTGTMAPE